MMNRIGLLLALVVLAAIPLQCKAASADQHAIFVGAERAYAACANLQGVHVLQGGKVVCLRGKDDATMFIGLLKMRHEISRHPYVIVSGPGGYVNSSIYMVRVLKPFGPIPVVGDMCASACAQILFLMGKQRVILHCADIAIHRGPASTAQELAGKGSDVEKETAIAAEWRFKQFYRDRHIDIDAMAKPPADIQKKLSSGQIVFWPWSINKLRAFGVKGIISDNNPDEVVPNDYGRVCIKPLAVQKAEAAQHMANDQHE